MSNQRAKADRSRKSALLTERRAAVLGMSTRPESDVHAVHIVSTDPERPTDRRVI